MSRYAENVVSFFGVKGYRASGVNWEWSLKLTLFVMIGHFGEDLHREEAPDAPRRRTLRDTIWLWKVTSKAFAENGYILASTTKPYHASKQEMPTDLC